jgi:predicted glycosyltransferase
MRHTTPPRVLFYVQHLQGIGHVVRGKRIADALVADGFDVTLVLGGMAIEGFSLGDHAVVQLPPLRASHRSFRELLTADGSVADADYKLERTTRLCDAFDRIRPDVLMIEAFPFDRPQMHFELIPLLERARQWAVAPLIVSSIRDILQWKSKPERDATARDLVERYFDAVLIHGDPTLARLEATFRHADEIGSMIRYTGIVAPPPPAAAKVPDFDVIVSSGGGGTDGQRVLEAAIRAKPRTTLADRKWLGLVGPFVGTEHHAGLARAAEETGVTLLPFVDGLANLMCRAELSISQAGYNTVADILRTRCRAVLCPYAGIRQNEQTERARRLAARGWVQMVDWEDISAATLAVAIDKACAMPRSNETIDLDGASGTAQALRDLMQRGA